MKREKTILHSTIKKIIITIVLTAVVCGFMSSVKAGSIFLTGLDSDFHASVGPNAPGAININNVAIDYVTDTAFNTFAASGINKFIYVESSEGVPLGHENPYSIDGHAPGIDGIVASGFALGTDFDHYDKTNLDAGIDLLGIDYNAIVVASDFGALLRQDELNILNNRKSDIINFLNAGGGIYVMGESNEGAHLTPDGGQYGFLPGLISIIPNTHIEAGVTLTEFGKSLGLVESDVNDNFHHNFFQGNFGLKEVSHDPNGNILSLAGRRTIDPVPEPATVALLGIGIVGLAGAEVRRRRKKKTVDKGQVMIYQD